MLIVDAHLDLAYNVGRGRDVTRAACEQPIANNEIATVGLPDLKAGGVGLICATIFCAPQRPGKPGYANAEEARAMALKQLAWYQRQIDSDRIRFVTSSSDLQPVEVDEPQNAVLLLEGADAFRSPADVNEFFDLGLRIVGLAWGKTRMAGGTDAPGPLTDEGRSIVKALDAAGIIHDASHLAEQSFWDLLEMSNGPVMASHSNCRAIVPTDRHLSDGMIKALAAHDGVIGCVFYDKFLMPPEEYGKRRCTLADVVKHVKHICDLVGDARHVGVGSDMDGGLGREEIPQEIRTSADLPRVGDALSAAGFGDDDVAAILGGNWLSFFDRSLPKS